MTFMKINDNQPSCLRIICNDRSSYLKVVFIVKKKKRKEIVFFFKGDFVGGAII